MLLPCWSDKIDKQTLVRQASGWNTLECALASYIINRQSHTHLCAIKE